MRTFPAVVSHRHRHHAGVIAQQRGRSYRRPHQGGSRQTVGHPVADTGQQQRRTAGSPCRITDGLEVVACQRATDGYGEQAVGRAGAMELSGRDVQPTKRAELVVGEPVDWTGEPDQPVAGVPRALDVESCQGRALGIEQVELSQPERDLSGLRGDDQGDRRCLTRGRRRDEARQWRLEATVDEQVEVVELTWAGGPLRNRDVVIGHGGDCATSPQATAVTAEVGARVRSRLVTATEILLDVVRSGFVEGHHRGSVVALSADGGVDWSIGDVTSQIYPRSCNKPVQALGMLRCGLELDGDLLALTAASHSGEPFHVDGVRRILDSVGLDERALQTPPDYPLDEAARVSYIRSGLERSPIAMNCSGKHAAMLATCVVNSWPIENYRDPDHPLQTAIAKTFAELTGEVIESVGVDGCGAPLFSASLTGLAQAFRAIVLGDPGSLERRVADAYVGSPEFASGSTRDEAKLLRAVPGAIGKAGAESCYAVALPDGRAVALKIEDGSPRGRPAVMAAALRRLGVDRETGVDGEALNETGRVVLLGGGMPVGELRPTF